MKQTRALALCGVTAALAVAVMAAGGVLGIGTYISPLIAGMCLLPVGPLFERLPRIPRLLCKLLFFNAVAIALEALVMLLLVPETMQTPLLLLLLVLGNVVFVLYDVLIPRIAYLLNKRLSAFLR